MMQARKQNNVMNVLFILLNCEVVRFRRETVCLLAARVLGVPGALELRLSKRLKI